MKKRFMRVKVRAAVIWSLVNTGEKDIKWHSSVTEEEKTVTNLMPIVSALFPGINYYSITGFISVMQRCVMPALKRLHPKLIGVTAGGFAINDNVRVEAVLPSNGYEWQDSDWQAKFERFLVNGRTYSQRVQTRRAKPKRERTRKPATRADDSHANRDLEWDRDL